MPPKPKAPFPFRVEVYLLTDISPKYLMRGLYCTNGNVNANAYSRLGVRTLFYTPPRGLDRGEDQA